MHNGRAERSPISSAIADFAKRNRQRAASPDGWRLRLGATPGATSISLNKNHRKLLNASSRQIFPKNESIDIHLSDDPLLQSRPSALCPELNIQSDIFLAASDIDPGL